MAIRRFGGLAGMALAGIASVGLTGCVTMTPEERDMLGFVSVLGMNDPSLTQSQQAGFAGIAGVVDAQNDRANAAASAPQINVNVNNGGNSYPIATRVDINPELITYNTITDINNNGGIEDIEIFGLNKNIFSLSREEISAGLRGREYSGKVKFQSWTETGILIGETEILFDKPYKIYGRCMGLNHSKTQGDFMDNLKWAGSGNYRITATLDNGKILAEDITLTE